MKEQLSIQNRIDLHIHTYPCLFPRIADDREVVKTAAEAGMKGIALKCHHESTASRAYLLRDEFPEPEIYGGIVLNSYVGGINPAAVEACLRLGGRIVWMPTIDSSFHAQKHGGRTGVYDVQSSGREGEGKQGISIMRDGELIEEARQVIDLVVQYSAVLATCHLSFSESYALLKAAQEAGAEKLLVTHPFFKVPALTLEETERLVGLGAYAEFGYCTVSPMWQYASMDKVAEAIRRLAAAHCVLVSDGGQPHNPMPTESFRVYLQGLWEKGISIEELDRMTITNPNALLEK